MSVGTCVCISHVHISVKGGAHDYNPLHFQPINILLQEHRREWCNLYQQPFDRIEECTSNGPSVVSIFVLVGLNVELCQTAQDMQRALEISRQAREEDLQGLNAELAERDQLLLTAHTENDQVITDKNGLQAILQVWVWVWVWVWVCVCVCVEVV